MSSDGATRISLRFRIQQVFTLVDEEGEGLNRVEWQIRRTRFRLGGTVMDPRLSFDLQLSFARNDLDFTDTGFANVLRDAVVRYQVLPNLQVMAGQTKLPGNRQRVVSSADLELPERSIVNSRFTFDRDVGFQAWFADTLSGQIVRLRTAVSNGEGRNPSSNDEGIALTGRVEWLPLGGFSGGGDYVEGDLAGESAPRLALAVSGQHNSNTLRTNGQLGPRLHAPRTFSTIEADVLFRYRGLSVYGEWAKRSADDPITTAVGSSNRYVYVGQGGVVQASMQAGRGWAPVIRWSRVTPDEAIEDQAGAAGQTQSGVGVTKYFNGHRIKSSLELLRDRHAATSVVDSRELWSLRWGLELGI